LARLGKEPLRLADQDRGLHDPYELTGICPPILLPTDLIGMAGALAGIQIMLKGQTLTNHWQTPGLNPNLSIAVRWVCGF
jgi:hypothetical protein